MKTTTEKLLVLLVVALVAVLAVWWFMDGDDDDDDKGGAPPLAVLDAGQTVNRDTIKEAGVESPPPAKVDTSRLAATYEPGKTYGTLAKISVQSRGSHKDWGVTAEVNFTYLGELQLSRYIEKNDGSTMTLVMQVDRAATISAFTKVDGIKIELGPLAQTALELSGPYAGLPPGWSEVTKQSVESLLNNEISREFLSAIASDEAAKSFAFVDSIQGKKARIVIENGVGVQSITALDCQLSSDEQLFFESVSFYSDAVLMKDLNCRPGDSWRVEGRDLMPLFDPSMGAHIDGQLTVRRGEDVEEGGNAPAAAKPKAILSIESGLLKLRERHSTSSSGKVRQMGSWAPTGSMVFDFGHGIVTEGKLAGSIELVEESTDHILFEMRNVVKPTYEVHYSAWVEQGEQLEADFSRRQPPVAVEPALLDRIESRLRP